MSNIEKNASSSVCLHFGAVPRPQVLNLFVAMSHLHNDRSKDDRVELHA